MRAHSERLAAQLHAQRESLFPPTPPSRCAPSPRVRPRRCSASTTATCASCISKGAAPPLPSPRQPAPLLGRGHPGAARFCLKKPRVSPAITCPGAARMANHLQVIGVMNFKGGSGKTTTSAHLAQRLALTGYRVLASTSIRRRRFTALHGVQPEFDLQDGGTLYDAIRYDDPVPIATSSARPTSPTSIIVPGNLELMEFEHETPRALSQGQGRAVLFPRQRGSDAGRRRTTTSSSSTARRNLASYHVRAVVPPPACWSRSTPKCST